MIKLKDNFFAPRQLTGLKVTIPSALQRCEETGRLKAFRLKWKSGEPNCPHIYWDSDVAKVMEGMALAGKLFDDKKILQCLDELTELVISAQQPDGYLNTHFTVTDFKQRWKNLYDCHELYCAGHLMEAAVARFRCTGKRDFLEAMCKYADYIIHEFGPDGKPGYPGHEEIELALIKLYQATNEKKYLEQARLFIERRGKAPNYFLSEEVEGAQYRDLYNRQAHQPVTCQHEAVGHAVRAVYLYCGMADVANETGDQKLLDVCKTLFDSIVNSKMYLTGGIGSRQYGESFGISYELQRQNAYAESCAAIGFVFFASRMLKATNDVKYADVIERLIFNGAISGISLRGDSFFYSNPMECSEATAELGHIKRTRQPWYNTSCCPTSYCRFLPQLGDFCYRIDKENCFILDVPVSADIKTKDCYLKIRSDYPYDGKINCYVISGTVKELSIRIPEWCNQYEVSEPGTIKDRYWHPNRTLSAGDCVTFNLKMESEFIYPNPKICDLRGMTAIRRGPLIYCIESIDLNGESPSDLYLPVTQKLKPFPLKGLQKNTLGLHGYGFLAITDDKLYSTTSPTFQKIKFVAVPYALWQNRGNSDMSIFFPIFMRRGNFKIKNELCEMIG